MLRGPNGLHSCAEVLVQLDDCLNVVVELSYEHDIAGKALRLALLVVAVNLVDEQPAAWDKHCCGCQTTGMLPNAASQGIMSLQHERYSPRDLA